MQPDYDDPAIEEQWCNERQQEVAAYLNDNEIEHGQIGEWPTWHLAPYVSIWAIESKKSPGWVGWWVICGDLPTDYVSAETIKHPRVAMNTFGSRWLEASNSMSQGKKTGLFEHLSDIECMELAPLLESRATALLQFSNDETLWEESEL